MTMNSPMTVWLRNPNDDAIHYMDFSVEDLDDIGEEIMAWYAVFQGEDLVMVTATLRGEGPEAAGIEDAVYDGPFDLWQREIK